MNRYGARLFDQHAAQLEASGIDPDVATERGYVSVDQKTRLAKLGYQNYQQRVPGLLIPVHGVSGEVVAFEYRPDVPRTNGDGKTVKYEPPTGSRAVLDVPCRVRPLLGDPDVDLYITEGAKKADAAAGKGMCCISIAGVWKWRGTNDAGGKTALPDWELVALNGRTVYLVFDSDVMTKPAVAKALERLKAFLEYRGAKVLVVYLPHCADGSKCGLDDYLLTHPVSDLWALARPDVPAPALPAATDRAGIDGATLLDALAGELARYIAFPSDAARDAVALWAAHSHLLDAFESTPRLALLSPEKGSGKTRTLEVLEALVPAPMHVANCTAAALFRSVAASRSTVLFDECDTYFGPRSAKDHEELRGLINAGHRRGAVAYRCVGEKQEVRAFQAYAAVALAGIGDLPDTILDRAVVVAMRRRAPHERVEPFRQRHATPALQSLKKRMSEWAKQVADEAGEADPDMPDGIVDRPADVWEPLLVIADLAQGDWPERARRAAVELNAARQKADPSLGVRLLADMRDVFDGADALFTDTLLEKLVALDEAPWGDLRGKALDARGLARRMRRFQVGPKPVRLGAVVKKGYTAEDLADAWTRYLPALPPEKSGTSGTRATPQVTGPDSVPASEGVPDGRVTDFSSGTDSNALTSTCTAVTLVPLPGGGRAPANVCVVCGAPCDPSFNPHPACQTNPSSAESPRLEGRRQ